MMIRADAVVLDEGSVVIFRGTLLEEGEEGSVRFACDHRMAQVIASAIDEGEEPVCDVPEWALLGR